MLTFHATQVEQFRLVMETSWADEQELLASLAGKLEPNWQMRGGSAWHKLLETGQAETEDRGNDQWLSLDGFLFRPEAVCAAKEAIGPIALREVKVTTPIQVAGRTVELITTCDGWQGTDVTEVKTKWSAPDMKFYEDSLQWRMYLWVLEASSVRYHLFHFSEPYGGQCELKSITSFRCWPYEGLAEDCLEWLEKFVRWLDAKGIKEIAA